MVVISFLILYTTSVLKQEKKKALIDQSKTNPNDSGSSSVQITIISARISELHEHLKENPKDKHSRLGLVKLVEKRRKHITYLKKNNMEEFQKISQLVGIKN